MYEILININNLYQIIIYYFFIIYFLDIFLVFLFGDKSRWFQLHSITNLYICYLVSGDVYNLLLNPINNLNLLVDRGSTFTCITLHLYHCFMFNINTMDKFHHFLFVFHFLFWLGHPTHSKRYLHFLIVYLHYMFLAFPHIALQFLTISSNVPYISLQFTYLPLHFL